MRLQDKVAIVTGGGQGIGRAYSLRFADGGGVRRRLRIIRAEEAKAVESEIEATGASALAIHADVADEEGAARMVAETVERFGRVDILVNNAAIYFDLELGDTSIDYLRRVLDVNLVGILVCGRAVFPQMKEQGGGSIINISSIASYMFNKPPARGGELLELCLRPLEVGGGVPDEVDGEDGAVPRTCA